MYLECSIMICVFFSNIWTWCLKYTFTLLLQFNFNYNDYKDVFHQVRISYTKSNTLSYNVYHIIAQMTS